MRPGQNKRMRGRNSNNNRKGPNPLTRSYESNGPDVKIRGTAHHIGEKYLQLARDAQSSGDPVMAESYLQHAEHYFRLIAAAQQAQQQAQFGYQRQPGDTQDGDDEDGDEDFTALPDRFASPGERQPQPQPNVPQPYTDRPPFSDRQPYDGRQDQRRQEPARQDSGRQESGRQDHSRNEQGRQDQRNFDRQGGDRQPFEGRDRQYDNRRGSYSERNSQAGADHLDRGFDRNSQDRNGQDRNGQDRNGQDRSGQDRSGQDRNAQDGPPRDYDNRNFRNRNRDFQPREQRQPVLEEPTNGLPAFITGPSRPPPESEPQPEVQAPANVAGSDADDSGQHMRPRRRRRPKAEFEGVENPDGERGHDGRQDAPASDPVGD